MDTNQINQNQSKAIELAKRNDLINYCYENSLNPNPEGSNLTNWYASCPSGGNHKIMISTISNQWGCGYCRKKGDLKDLKQFMESVKNRFLF